MRRAAPIPAGHGRCRQCWQIKPASELIGSRGAKIHRCLPCRERYANWTRKDLAEKLAGAPARNDAAPTGRVLWVARTKDRKLGGIPASYSERGTCPPSCGLYEAGCYASYGKQGGHWKRVGRDLGLEWPEFLSRVLRLPRGTLWRHNVAGDLQGDGRTIDPISLLELSVASRGRRGFTFTHYPLTSDNITAILNANRLGFAVNVSTDTIEAADAAMMIRSGRPLNPFGVVTILPHDAGDKAFRTPGGNTVVVCPAETAAGLKCSECRLCANSARQAIVGFKAHGQYRKHVPELVQLRRKASKSSPSEHLPPDAPIDDFERGNDVARTAR